MKKILYSILISICILFTTGCTSYDDATLVAIEMLDYLIEENYTDASQLINNQGGLIINEVNLIDFIDSLNYDFTTVTEYSVVEESEDTVLVENSKVVEINLGENKVFSLNMQKIDGSWYVTLDESYLKTDLQIIVAENSIVKIDGIELDRDIYSEVLETKLSSDYGTELTLYKLQDVYTIPYMLEGTYELTVEHDGLETLDQTIYTDLYKFDSMVTNKSDYFVSSYTNYELLKNFTSTETTTITTFVKNYLEKFTTAVNNNSEFSLISLYFYGSNTDMYNIANTEYVDFIGQNIKEYSYYTKTNCDYVFELYSIDSISYITDEIVILKATIDITYNNKKEYIGTSSWYDESDNTTTEKNKTIETYITLIKVDGDYLIHGQTNLFPYISNY